jgi:hypothetical protein
MEPGTEEEVIICASTYWNKTNVDVKPGERYLFTAEGEWRDLFHKHNADGKLHDSMKHFTGMLRHKNKLFFTLIGSIDREEDFVVGKSLDKTFDRTGRLWFYANDVPLFYWNNTGKLKLKIKRIQ